MPRREPLGLSSRLHRIIEEVKNNSLSQLKARSQQAPPRNDIKVRGEGDRGGEVDKYQKKGRGDKGGVKWGLKTLVGWDLNISRLLSWGKKVPAGFPI